MYGTDQLTKVIAQDKVMPAFRRTGQNIPGIGRFYRSAKALALQIKPRRNLAK